MDISCPLKCSGGSRYFRLGVPGSIEGRIPPDAMQHQAAVQGRLTRILIRRKANLEKSNRKLCCD